MVARQTVGFLSLLTLLLSGMNAPKAYAFQNTGSKHVHQAAPSADVDAAQVDEDGNTCSLCCDKCECCSGDCTECKCCAEGKCECCKDGSCCGTKGSCSGGTCAGGTCSGGTCAQGGCCGDCSCCGEGCCGGGCGGDTDSE